MKWFRRRGTAGYPGSMARFLPASTAVLSSLLAGCGLLFGVDGLSGGESEGAADAAPDMAATDADVPPADGAVRPDDASAEAATPFCQPTDLFCDTFDQGRFDPRWSALPAGAELQKSDVSSAPYAAKMAPTTNINSFLRVVLTPPGGAQRFTGVLDVEFAFRTAVTSVIVGQLGFERNGETGGFQVFANANDLTMGMTFPNDNRGNIQVPRDGTPFERARVSITLSPDGTPKPVSLNSTPPKPTAIPYVAFEPTKITLDIGFVTVPGTTAGVVYVDDVRVSQRAP